MERSRPLRVRGLLISSLTVTAIAVASCGGTTGPAASPLAESQASGGGTLSPPPTGLPTSLPTNPKVIATLTFQVGLTGAAPLSGSISRKLDLDFKASRPCSDLAVDDIFFDGPIGTHTVALVLVATDPSLKTGTIGLDVASSLTIDQAEESTFAPGFADTTKVVLDADGTGHLDLANWGSSIGAMESGTITWTCRT